MLGIKVVAEAVKADRSVEMLCWDDGEHGLAAPQGDSLGAQDVTVSLAQSEPPAQGLRPRAEAVAPLGQGLAAEKADVADGRSYGDHGCAQQSKEL